MKARYHGEPATEQDRPRFATLAFARDNRPSFDFAFARDLTPGERLNADPATVEVLRDLGAIIGESPGTESADILAIHTYFGQFIDHDITKLALQVADEKAILDENFPVFDLAQVHALQNSRFPALDLDSVYGGDAADMWDRSTGKMLLGPVTEVLEENRPIPTETLLHDVPRRPKPKNRPANDDEAAHADDRRALIGDPRNDENLIVSQLHVAFLRSHNALVDKSTAPTPVEKFEFARRELTQRYQGAVLNDYLKHVGDPEVVAAILQDGPRHWTPTQDEIVMPIEFSGAAFRFGHSMIRDTYDFNSTFNSSEDALAAGTLRFMFTFTALSGQLGPDTTWERQPKSLPNNWIIEWKRFFDARNLANKIDANLALGLSALPDQLGNIPAGIMSKLAVRNLLRGYQLGLPTGQAMATRMGLPSLDPEAIISCMPAHHQERMKKTFIGTSTPLWFYILAEA